MRGSSWPPLTEPASSFLALQNCPRPTPYALNHSVPRRPRKKPPGACICSFTLVALKEDLHRATCFLGLFIFCAIVQSRGFSRDPHCLFVLPSKTRPSQAFCVAQGYQNHVVPGGIELLRLLNWSGRSLPIPSILCTSHLPAGEIIRVVIPITLFVIRVIGILNPGQGQNRPIPLRARLITMWRSRPPIKVAHWHVACQDPVIGEQSLSLPSFDSAGTSSRPSGDVEELMKAWSSHALSVP
jgi:hypothetical protein